MPEECGTVGGEYGIDLVNADLNGTKLTKTALYQTRFLEAELRHADLREALLLGSNLRGADLRRADLREANLTGAWLNGADLRGSDMRGADIDMATLNKDPDRSGELNGILVTLEGREARLQGADLRELRNWTPAQLETGYWDENTKWPSGYVPRCRVNLPREPCGRE